MWPSGQANGSVERRRGLQQSSATLRQLHRPAISDRSQFAARSVPLNLDRSASVPNLTSTRASAVSCAGQPLFQPRQRATKLGLAPGLAGGGKSTSKIAAVFRQAADALVKPKADLERLEQQMASDSLELASCAALLKNCRKTLQSYGNGLEDRNRALGLAQECTDGHRARDVRRRAEDTVLQRAYGLVLFQTNEEMLASEVPSGQGSKLSSGSNHVQLTPKVTAASTGSLMAAPPWSTTPVLERYAAGKNFMATSGLAAAISASSAEARVQQIPISVSA